MQVCHVTNYFCFRESKLKKNVIELSSECDSSLVIKPEMELVRKTNILNSPCEFVSW